MIGPHLQETTNYHAQPDATPVTKQDVQNDLIPPAFSKIRQKVHEEELSELPGDANSPAQAVAADQ